MANIDIRVDGTVGAQPVKHGALEMRIKCGDDTLFLHGNPGAFRAFAEAILMSVPPPRVERVRSEDGTEITLNGELQ